MPVAPLRPCANPACPRQVKEQRRRYCEECQPAEWKKQNDQPHRKEMHSFYHSKAWFAVRRQVLSRDPVCVLCRQAEATTVDHIKDRTEAPELELEPSNLQGVCKRCHGRKTAAGPAFRPRAGGGVNLTGPRAVHRPGGQARVLPKFEGGYPPGRRLG